MEIQTSTGHVIFLKKDYLTYDERRQVKKVMGNQFKFVGLTGDAITNKDFSKVNIEMDTTIDDEANLLTVSFYIGSIKTPEGTVIGSNIIQFLKDQRTELTDEIITKIKEATEKQNGEKKEVQPQATI